jgi:hypothetical protein
MAGEQQNNGEAQGEEFDRPKERADAYFERLGVPASGYSIAITQALERYRHGDADPAARGWVSIGPRNVGGAVRCLAQHPLLPDVLFAGSAQGGLWKSEDNGYSWRPVGAPDLTVPVGAIAFAPSNPQIIYVGTGEPTVGNPGGIGLYKSEDGGGSFSQMVGTDSADDGAAGHYACILVDPLEPGRFWAASSRGLWRHDPGVFGGFALEAVSSPTPGDNVTDVVLARDPAHADTYVLLAGVNGVGIFRAVFSSGSTGRWTPAVNTAAATAPVNPTIPLPAAGTIGRIRLAFSGVTAHIVQPIAYAIMEDQGVMGRVAVNPRPKFNRLAYPTYVYRSQDFGAHWDAAAGSVAVEAPTIDDDGQAYYSLSIAVDPSDPTHVIVGYTDLHRSMDSGRTFVQILDGGQYNRGDHAQHADHHAIVFDRRNSRSVWLCNDGGISFTPDYTTPANPAAAAPLVRWRKRSYGIGAAQFFAIATHPRFPFMCGGGMQDNGTFVSYGGLTWYPLRNADGGQMAFDPVNPRQFVTSTQASIRPVQIVAPGPGAPVLFNSTLPDVDPPGNVMLPAHGATLAFPPANGSVFVGIVEGDPVTAGRLLLGRVGAGFYTEDGGTTLAALNTPFPAPAPGATPDEVSTLAFAPGAPDLWLGTNAGLLFTAAASPPHPPAAGPAWTARAIPGVTGRINAIVVHPQNPNVVAVAIRAAGQVYLSHDRGANWAQIHGTDHALPPGPILSLAFDPANLGVLFAGTLVGVWVARNLPAPGGPALGASFDAQWKTYSSGLPPIQINDLEVTPIKNTLRCATFGRGAYESDLPTTAAAFQIPEVMLSIRGQPIDDGRIPNYPNAMADDPRVPPGRLLSRTDAFDIRVDAPGFIRSEAFAFGEAIDGVEFDETLVSDKPLVGDINHVYVQVQNRGWGIAANVKVSLYFAKAVAGPAGALTPPPIGNNIGFPDDPAAGSAWQRAAPPETIGALGPGEPVVVKFDWIPPLEVTDGVALLAVASNDKDSPAAIPAGNPVAFVTGERRAALRISAVNRDTVYIRDGVDDDGRPGGVAWGVHSPDIIVQQAAVANPDDHAGPFKDLDAQRSSDVVKAGANFIYVRVFNRTRVPANATVKVYAIPTFDPARTTQWQQLPQPVPVDVPVNGIPPGDWKFATINWNGVTDPDPANASAYKGFVLLAAAKVTDAANNDLDPYPDFSSITDLDSFWQFLASAPLANNAAVRALRFQS